MIKENDYVKIKKVTGDFAEEFKHCVGKIYQVKEVIDLEHMKPLKYGLRIEGHGMCYFSDEEVELMRNEIMEIELDKVEKHFQELSVEQFEKNLIECGIGKINTCEEDGVIMITHNEICTLCKERADDGYCYNIGVQTDDEDIEITYCHEFKPLIE